MADKQAILDRFTGRWEEFYGKYLPTVSPLGGDEHRAKCPFHADKTPSFNFSGENGKYYCHACGKGGDPLHFYAKLNSLDTRRDFGRILSGIAKDFGLENGNGRPKRRIVATYDYIDSHGAMIFQVVRFEPKDFGQRRPNGLGGWVWKMKGVELVPFNLPAVLKADQVLIVEGEKDVLNLGDLGFTATTSPMGAKKWRMEFAEYFQGKDIVLIPDNDNPGRAHMAQVGAALKDVARSIRWLDLPGVGSGGDASDWIKANAGDPAEARAAFKALIDKTKPYTPPKAVTLEDAILADAEFFHVEMPQKKAILHPWLCEMSISQITGWRGTGKTWFAMGVVDAITRGEGFGPWEIGNPVPCLYLEGEMPASDVRQRFQELAQGAERKAPLYVYSDAYANHLGLPRANLAAERWRTEMKRILMTRGVKVWVADNLASLCPGIDENKKQDWDPINSWLLELRFAGISTVFLHHTNKTGGQRGTSAREDNIDTAIMLKAPHDYTPEDGARFIATFQKSRVRARDLALVADVQFKLEQDEAGRLMWTYGSVKRETRREVLRLLNEGCTQSEVVETLGLSKGYVSKTRSQAIKDGLLSKDNKLTLKGFDEVNADA